MTETREASGGSPSSTPLVSAPRARRAAGTVGLLLDGRYRLQQRRTRDGSSSTWEGTDDQLDRPVVVRVVAGRTAGATVAAARRSAVLEDRRLARVLDVGTSLAGDGGALGWVVTERAAGRQLADLLRVAPMSASRSRSIVAQAAAALARAASMDLNHRRLDPSSILVAGSGDVTVLDLEIAAAAAGLPPLSAERAEREDARGLACLAYACLTGLWPQGRFAALGAAPTSGGLPVAPSALVAGVPDDLDALVEATLSGRPGAPCTPADVADALAARAGSAMVDLTALRVPRSPGHPGVSGQPDVVGQPGAEQVPPMDEAFAELGSTAPYLPVFIDGSPAPVPVDDVVDVRQQNPGRSPDAPTVGPTTRAASRPPANWPPAWEDTGRWDNPWQQRIPTTVGTGTDGRSHRTGRARRPTVVAALTLVLLAVLVLVGLNLRPLGAALGVRTAARVPDAASIPGSTATGSAGSTGAAGPTSATASTSNSTPLRIVADHPLDPQGDGTENDAQAPRAIDGNPATTWSTSTYTSASFGGLKRGVGLALDLGASVAVHSVDVTIAGTGGALQVQASRDGTEATSTVVASAPISSTASATAGTTASDAMLPGQTLVHVQLPQATTTRYVVVWFTALPRAATGYAATVSEVTVH